MNRCYFIHLNLKFIEILCIFITALKLHKTLKLYQPQFQTYTEINLIIVPYTVLVTLLINHLRDYKKL